jgi:hypothetical protein
VVSDDEPFHALQTTVPSGFEEFTAEVGEPAVGNTPPELRLDPALLVESAARHQIEILGPPPTTSQ